MTPFTIAAIAFVLALLLFGFAFWTPIYALPLALLVMGGFGLAEFARRRGSSRELREFRAQADKAGPHRESDFTDRDRETLYEKP
jgi:hypothetical protein